jgi:hypothetical protein
MFQREFCRVHRHFLSSRCNIRNLVIKPNLMAMKSKFLFYLTALLIGLSSCDIYSVHPLYTSKDLVRENRITGLWKEEEKKDSFVEIKVTSQEPAYQIKYWEDTDTIWYEAHLLKLGTIFFLDLYPLDKYPYEVSDLMLKNYVPMHSFMKLEINRDTMSVNSFDGKKMIELFKQNRIRLKHEMLDDCVMITASTEDLQKFIRKYSSNHEAFTEPMIFIKK